MSQQNLIIFDTTMRDGEQSPGALMTRDEKLRIARALERMRVDVIEAGFPAASPDDLAAVQSIAAEIGQTAIEGRPQETALVERGYDDRDLWRIRRPPFRGVTPWNRQRPRIVLVQDAEPRTKPHVQKCF